MKRKDGLKVKEYLDAVARLNEIEKEERELKEFIELDPFDHLDPKKIKLDIVSPSFSNTSVGKELGVGELFSKLDIPILSINNLTKYYQSRNTPSLVAVNLRVYLGDFHVVMGDYGSGKTTIFNCLFNSEKFDGEILVDGISINSASMKLRDLVGFVPSDINWQPYETVEDVVFNECKNLDLARNDAEKYLINSLKTFRMNLHRFRPIIDLTLFEKKKIQLLIALIKKPILLVLDEPLLGIQQDDRMEYLSLINSLRCDGRGIIAFTSLFNEYGYSANTATLLGNGKVYYSGLIENLQLDNQNKYSIITSDNNAALELLKKNGCVFNYDEQIDVISVKFDGKLELFVFQKACVNSSLIIKELKKAETTIDDLYSILVKIGTSSALKDINYLENFIPTSKD